LFAANTAQVELTNSSRFTPESAQWQLQLGLNILLAIEYLVLCIIGFILVLNLNHGHSPATRLYTWGFATHSFCALIAMAIGIYMDVRMKSPFSIQIGMLANWAAWVFCFVTQKLTTTLWVLWQRQRWLKKLVVADVVGADNDRANKEDWRAWGYPSSSLD
jgi:hypothetical protein